MILDNKCFRAILKQDISIYSILKVVLTPAYTLMDISIDLGALLIVCPIPYKDVWMLTSS